MLDAQLAFMVALLILLCALAWWRGGEVLLREGMGQGVALLTRYGLLIAVSFVAAGVAQTLVPQGLVAGALGHGSGLRGILIATAAGAITPSGPFVSMPIAAVMLRAGAAPAAVVAFLTAWSLLALHRLVAWEIPVLGARFAAFRYAVSLLLPVAAGLLTRLIARSMAS